MCRFKDMSLANVLVVLENKKWSTTFLNNPPTSVKLKTHLVDLLTASLRLSPVGS